MRVRLTLGNVAVMAVLLVVFGAGLCIQVRQELSRSIDQELIAHARFAQLAGFSDDNLTAAEAGPSPPEALSSDPAPAPSTLPDATAPNRRKSHWKPMPDIEEGFIPPPRFLTPQGQPLIPGELAWDPSACVRAAAGQDVFSVVQVSGVPARILSVPFRHRQEVVGVIQVAHSLVDLDRTVDGEVRTLWILLPPVLLVAGIIGIVFAGRALAPMRRITRAAEAIEAGDFTRRLEVQGDDELADLSRTFNGMIMRMEGAFRAREAAFDRLRLTHEELERAYKRMETAFEQQRRFASDASHELRTPLTRLKAMTSLSLSSARTPEEYRRALEVADRSADSMVRIVQDLLLLARADAAQLRMAMEIVPLDGVLRSAIERVKDPAAAPITLHLPERIAAVLGDSEHLVRLFINLLENALDHTPPEGRVHVLAVLRDREAHVWVEDTGEGIPAEHLPHVCERFYRADESRSRTRGGTGLGLAICQSIVFAHGGKMKIESEVGWGTRVQVILPLVTEGDDEDEEALSPEGLLPASFEPIEIKDDLPHLLR